jgi:HSP20 family protein
MANIGVEIAPARAIRSTGFNPFRSLLDFDRELSRFFEGGRKAQAETALNAWTPAVDVYEDENAFLIKVELPEVSREDVKVNLSENTLSISGERRFENEDRRDGYHRVERSYGQFYRSFALPPNVNAEGISAQYKDGVLRLTLPKKEEARPRQIDVAVS